MFNSTPDDLDMHVVYDVSHNIAKVRCRGLPLFNHSSPLPQVEEHMVDGHVKSLLVHRKVVPNSFSH